MSVQCHELFIARNRVTIIDQHAHAHAAVGRSQHGVGQQLTGLVCAKNKVLKIEGSLGGIHHLHPGQEPVDAYRQHAKRGIPAVFTRRVCKLAAEAGLFRLSECRGGGLGKIGAGRKRRASTEDRDDQYDKRKVEPADHHRSPARLSHHPISLPFSLHGVRDSRFALGPLKKASPEAGAVIIIERYEQEYSKSGHSPAAFITVGDTWIVRRGPIRWYLKLEPRCILRRIRTPYLISRIPTSAARYPYLRRLS